MTSRPWPALLGLALLTGLSLVAQTPVPPPVTPKGTVVHREVRQQRRIAQGMRSGALTPRETIHLERQEARIDKNIGKAEADGKVTKGEQARITRQQNAESRRIFRKKHNARTMP